MKRSQSFFVLVLLSAIVGATASLAPAQSLFAQNKPGAVVVQAKADLESAQATLAAEKDKALAAKAAAEAAGNTKSAEELAKAIAFYDKAMDLNQKALAVAGAIVTPDGDVSGEAVITTVGGLVPFPFNIITLLVGGIGWREYRAWRDRQAAAAALAAAAQEAAAAAKQAADNEAAARSLVNSVDQMKIASPAIAGEIARLASGTDTDPKNALTPRAVEILNSERLA